MTKNILAIAIAAAVMAPSAFAAATVYGVAHVGMAQQSDVSNGATIAGTGTGTAAAAGSVTNVLSNSSRLGIKGSEDLGAGLKAVYQMEMAVNMDGETGSSDPFGTGLRNTFAGIGGGFGTVLMGRHDSPIKMVGRSYDLFGDQIGNNRNLLGGGANGAYTTLVDGRHSNVLAYATPTMGGFSGLLAYVPGAGRSNEYMSNDVTNTTTGANTSNASTVKQDAWSAMAGYKAGAFGASLGYINVDKLNGTDAFTATRLGAEYTFGAAKVVALYQNAKIVDSQDSYGLGGSYKVGAAGTVKAQYYVASDVKSGKIGANMITVGYDHALSKSTTAYVAYAAVDNDTNGRFTANMSNGGSGDNTTAIAGKDNSAFSVGLIHNF